MTYEALKKILDSKKIDIQEISEKLGMTPNGFRKSIKGETIPLHRIKIMCEYIGINPLLLFEDVKYESVSSLREIELLKQSIADKEEIIKLLKKEI